MMKTKIPMYIAVRLERGYGDTERAVWLPLPATKKEFEAAQQAIGADYYDFSITCYNVRVPGLNRGMLLSAPLGRVNYLASRLAALDEDALTKLAAIIDSDRYFTELEQFIDYTYNNHRYTLLPGVSDAAALGRIMLDSEAFASVPPEIKVCIDKNLLGLNTALMQDGQFTALGYLTSDDGWRTVSRNRKVPVALNLTGIIGEDLYGEWEDDTSFTFEIEDGGDE